MVTWIFQNYLKFFSELDKEDETRLMFYDLKSFG